MGKFRWLLGPRASEEEEATTSLTFQVTRDRDALFTGCDLVRWTAYVLEWDIVSRLTDVSTVRGEHVVVTPLAHVCVGPRRVGMWQQSWKVVSNAAVTFKVLLAVEDRDPTVLHMRMTQYPSLQFPPLSVELTQLVREHAGIELLEATSDVGNLELRGASFNIRPHLVWNPGRVDLDPAELWAVAS